MYGLYCYDNPYPVITLFFVNPYRVATTIQWNVNLNKLEFLAINIEIGRDSDLFPSLAVALRRQRAVESAAAVHVLARLALGDGTHPADVGVGHVLPLGGVETDGNAHHLHHLQFLRIHVAVTHRSGRGRDVPSAGCRVRVGSLLILLMVMVRGGRGRLAAALVAAGVGRGGRTASVRMRVAAVGAVPICRRGGSASARTRDPCLCSGPLRHREKGKRGARVCEQGVTDPEGEDTVTGTAHWIEVGSRWRNREANDGLIPEKVKGFLRNVRGHVPSRETFAPPRNTPLAAELLVDICFIGSVNLLLNVLAWVDGVWIHSLPIFLTSMYYA